MSILVDKNTRLLVQGITGSSGAFHANGCMEYGTNVVAGVTPGKGGLMFEGKVPVFDTVYEARQQTGCNATMMRNATSITAKTMRIFLNMAWLLRLLTVFSRDYAPL